MSTSKERVHNFNFSLEVTKLLEQLHLENDRSKDLQESLRRTGSENLNSEFATTSTLKDINSCPLTELAPTGSKSSEDIKSEIDKNDVEDEINNCFKKTSNSTDNDKEKNIKLVDRGRIKNDKYKGNRLQEYNIPQRINWDSPAIKTQELLSIFSEQENIHNSDLSSLDHSFLHNDLLQNNEVSSSAQSCCNLISFNHDIDPMYNVGSSDSWKVSTDSHSESGYCSSPSSSSVNLPSPPLLSNLCDAVTNDSFSYKEHDVSSPKDLEFKNSAETDAKNSSDDLTHTLLPFQFEKPDLVSIPYDLCNNKLDTVNHEQYGTKNYSKDLSEGYLWSHHYESNAGYLKSFSRYSDHLNSAVEEQGSLTADALEVEKSYYTLSEINSKENTPSSLDLSLVKSNLSPSTHEMPQKNQIDTLGIFQNGNFVKSVSSKLNVSTSNIKKTRNSSDNSQEVENSIPVPTSIESFNKTLSTKYKVCSTNSDESNNDIFSKNEKNTDSSIANVKAILNGQPLLDFDAIIPSDSFKSKPRILGFKLKTTAKYKLFYSSEFSREKCRSEYYRIYKYIQAGLFGTEDKKIIHYLDEQKVSNYRGTNLHLALLMKNKERIYCLIEIHKQYHKSLFEINSTDSNKKTVLDYAIEQKMHYIIKYLKENNAVKSIQFEKGKSKQDFLWKK